jgi:protein-S-isoprenylcysteine O-methyltransferase Ste14
LVSEHERPRWAATLGTVAFFFLAPGTVAGLVPWLITRWQLLPGWPTAPRAAGIAMIILGLALLVAAFAQFVREGRGTPAPVAPTEQLVVHGLYRFVRNPMYLAVGTVIIGQALLFPSLGVLIWAAVFAVAVGIFVKAYEEPTLQRRYGEQYTTYSAAVPGWRPRLTPWQPRR